MPVEVGAGTVVPHRGAGGGVASGDLHVAQRHAGVEHGGPKSMYQHIWVHSGHPDAGCGGEVLQPTGGRVPVHPTADLIAQDRPRGAIADGPVDGTADRWRQWNQDDLRSFADHPQHPVAVFLAEVADVRAVVIIASNCRWDRPRVGDSGGTVGRRT